MGLAALILALAVSVGACDAGDAKTADAPNTTLHSDTGRAALPPRPPLSAEEAARYREIARDAWRYFDAEYQPATGLVNAAPKFTNTTLWDVGAQLLAFVAARDLGLLDAATFDARVGKTLSTLERMPLFDGFAFNRFYSTTDATIAEKEPLGVSATDLGRFLVALHVIARRFPELAPQAKRIVARNDLAKLVNGGYLQGHSVADDGTRRVFQEGRVGYEQYIAAGFDRWGARVGPALTLRANARPASVLGVPVASDRRGQDRLLSEPFILYGLELGLTNEMADLAQRVLRAQQARYEQTGTITVVSEDAVAVKPYYFYYYCVLCSAKPFVVSVATPTTVLDSPRWVSTKAAFGWDALYPSDYTKRAVDYVQAARDSSRGWASGVFEGTRKSTNTFDINTAAVMLEVAAFQLRGRAPLVDPVASAAATR